MKRVLLLLCVGWGVAQQTLEPESNNLRLSDVLDRVHVLPIREPDGRLHWDYSNRDSEAKKKYIGAPTEDSVFHIGESQASLMSRFGVNITRFVNRLNSQAQSKVGRADFNLPTWVAPMLPKFMHNARQQALQPQRSQLLEDVANVQTHASDVEHLSDLSHTKLTVGHWYHKLNSDFDITDAEWLALSPQDQANYVFVGTPQDEAALDNLAKSQPQQQPTIMVQPQPQPIMTQPQQQIMVQPQQLQPMMAQPQQQQMMTAQPQQPMMTQPQQPMTAQPQQMMAQPQQQMMTAQPQQPMMTQPQQPMMAQPQQPMTAQPQQQMMAPQQPIMAQPQQPAIAQELPTQQVATQQVVTQTMPAQEAPSSTANNGDQIVFTDKNVKVHAVSDKSGQPLSLGHWFHRNQPATDLSDVEFQALSDAEKIGFSAVNTPEQVAQYLPSTPQAPAPPRSFVSTPSPNESNERVIVKAGHLVNTTTVTTTKEVVTTTITPYTEHGVPEQAPTAESVATQPEQTKEEPAVQDTPTKSSETSATTGAQDVAKIKVKQPQTRNWAQARLKEIKPITLKRASSSGNSRGAATLPRNKATTLTPGV